MAYGENHLWAYDSDLGRTREFTADELHAARGRTRENPMSERFPVCGSRQAVYDFMKENGFKMAGHHGDKEWHLDRGPVLGKLRAHIYGAGSKVRVYRDSDNLLVAEGPLEETLLNMLKQEGTHLPS